MTRKKILEIIFQNIENKDYSDFDNYFVFGANPYTEDICNVINKHDIILDGILDNSIQLCGQVVAGVKVFNPDILVNYIGKKVCIFIASQHIVAMSEQVKNILHSDFLIVELFDFVAYNAQTELEKKYWCNDVFDNAILDLELGGKIYKKIHTDGAKLFISPTVSIGDNYLWTLTVNQYINENNVDAVKVVVCSGGAARIVKEVGFADVVSIKEDEMELLIKFVLFCGEEETNALILYPYFNNCRFLDSIASKKGMAWEQIYPIFLYALGKDYEINFHDFHNVNIGDNELKEMGLEKNNSVIISPYANTVGELPIAFWEELVIELSRSGYKVFTNVSGNQKAIKGSKPLAIPFGGCANVLEYAGCFIALRNGLCDIVGKARCKQIILFRDRPQLYSTELMFNDLRVDGVLDVGNYVIYQDDYKNTISEVISKVIFDEKFTVSRFVDLSKA